MTDKFKRLAHAPADPFCPRPGYRHIFAFGPLMAHDHIKKLCPSPRFVTTGRYLSKRFVINDDGVATLSPRRDFTVHGVIWEISDVAQCGLDVALGMPGIRDRFGSLARSPAGKLVSSEYYGARNNRTFGKATREYLQPIIAAARHWNFPNAYIDEIAGWSQI
jgi:hypothetical protein